MQPKQSIKHKLLLFLDLLDLKLVENMGPFGPLQQTMVTGGLKTQSKYILNKMYVDIQTPISEVESESDCLVLRLSFLIPLLLGVGYVHLKELHDR